MSEDVLIGIGTKVDYARRIEFGFEGPDILGRVFHQPPQPYLRPAIDEHEAEVLEEIGDVLRQLVKVATV